jgi:hypothetical protein
MFVISISFTSPLLLARLCHGTFRSSHISCLAAHLPSQPVDNNDFIIKCRSYKRPQIQRVNVVYFVKRDEATMDENEMKSQVRAAAIKIIKFEDNKTTWSYSSSRRSGLVKKGSLMEIDGGKTSVKWCRCQMSYRFRCQVKFYEGEYYMALNIRG